MQFVSIRLVTSDINRLVAFYGMLTGKEANRPAPDFAEFRFAGAVLAISSEQLIARFNAGAAVAASNRSAIIEFEVEDVDATLAGLGPETLDIAMAPTDMPRATGRCCCAIPTAMSSTSFHARQAETKEARPERSRLSC